MLDWFTRKLTRLWNYERLGTPEWEAGYLYYTRNTGLQNQSPLYRRKGLGGRESLVLDPNRLSPDGTVALSGWSVSRDGSHIAYMTAASGSDWNEAQVMELRTRRRLPDRLKWLKFTSIAWAPDNRSFYYGRYPEPATSGTSELRDTNYYYRVHCHRLGDPQDADPLVYERADDKELSFGPTVSDDGQYLVLNVGRGTEQKDGIYYAELKGRVPVTPDVARLVEQGGADHRFIGNIGRTFYILTTDGAPRRRVMAIDLDQPARANWREVVPQGRDVIEQVTLVQRQLIVATLHDASSRVLRFGLDGSPLGEISLPGIGTASGFSARQDDAQVFFDYTSFTHPRSVFRYDVAAGRAEPFWAPKARLKPGNYETTQVFCRSADGTSVPMFLTNRKGVRCTGANPTLLYAYGGFDISLTPWFNPALIPWLDGGGVYAVANLRGGGEYGEEWHNAGTLARKQNVFDDFYAAAEWLVSHKWTSPEHLAIEGGSNGGLLVGAAITQRPELFRAALPKVGVLDMLRYHRFTIGWAWVPEYGSADNPGDFAFLRRYSPLHNIRKGREYPATLVTTADHDDRVVPAHSFKFAAALQVAQSGAAPVLIRAETKAGHGAGKPVSKVIAERAEELAFLAHETGMKPRD